MEKHMETSNEQVLFYTIIAGIGLVLLVFALSFTFGNYPQMAMMTAWLGFAAYVVVSIVALTAKKV